MAGYTGTPETNDLLQQLMAVLEKNRNERQATEQESARLNASSGFAAGLDKGLANRKPESAAASAPAASPTAKNPGVGARYAELYNKYDKDGYIKGGGQPQTYKNVVDAARQEQANEAFLPSNAEYQPPTDAGALEEQKKRFTQRLMMERGQTGGPLGGAGAPPPSNTPTTAGMDQGVIDSVSGSGGPVPQMGPPAAPPAAQGAVMPNPTQPDFAMLDWAAARQARGM